MVQRYNNREFPSCFLVFNECIKETPVFDKIIIELRLARSDGNHISAGTPGAAPQHYEQGYLMPAIKW